MSQNTSLAEALEGIERCDRKMNDFLVFVLVFLFCGFGCTIIALCWWFPAIFGTLAFAGFAWSAETERRKWEIQTANWEGLAQRISYQMEKFE